MTKTNEILAGLLAGCTTVYKRDILETVYNFIQKHRNGAVKNYAEIAKELGMSKGACQDAFRTFAKHGLVMIETKGRGGIEFKQAKEDTSLDRFYKKTSLRRELLATTYMRIKEIDGEKGFVTMDNLVLATGYTAGTLKLVVTFLKKEGICFQARMSDKISFEKESLEIEAFIADNNVTYETLRETKGHKQVTETENNIELLNTIDDQDKLIEQLKHILEEKDTTMSENETMLKQARLIAQFLKSHNGSVIISVVESMVGCGDIVDALEGLRLLASEGGVE